CALLRARAQAAQAPRQLPDAAGSLRQSRLGVHDQEIPWRRPAMNDAGHDGFLRRWARRKAQARAGTPEHDAPAPAHPAQDAASAEPAAPAEATPGASTAPEKRPADARQEPPALTLDDVRALTPRSEEHTSELQSRENLVC